MMYGTVSVIFELNSKHNFLKSRSHEYHKLGHLGFAKAAISERDGEHSARFHHMASR